MSDSLTKAHDEDAQSRSLCDKFKIPHGLVKTYGGFMSPDDVVVAYAKMQRFPVDSVPKDLYYREQLEYIDRNKPTK